MIRIGIIICLELLFLFSGKEGSNSKLSFKEKIPPYKPDRIIPYKFFHNTVRIKNKGNPATSLIVFISLHDDESTGQQVILSYLEQNNLAFIQIENNKHRLIRFIYLKKSHAFDPKMFSKKGIMLTLKLNGTYSPIAANKVKQFAALILQQLLKAKTIISVHNNSNGKYSILSYLKGGKLFRNAIRVKRVPKSDPDNFFLTASLFPFERLKKKNFNILLQDNTHVFDDRSLSVYYRNSSKRYINIEAKKGHFSVQIKMLQALMSVL